MIPKKQPPWIPKKLPPLDKVRVGDHGRPQSCFLGWANPYLGRAKDFLTLFTPKIYHKWAFLCILFHKSLIPGPGISLVLPPICVVVHVGI